MLWIFYGKVMTLGIVNGRLIGDGFSLDFPGGTSVRTLVITVAVDLNEYTELPIKYVGLASADSDFTTFKLTPFIFPVNSNETIVFNVTHTIQNVFPIGCELITFSCLLFLATLLFSIFLPLLRFSCTHPLHRLVQDYDSITYIQTWKIPEVVLMFIGAALYVVLLGFTGYNFVVHALFWKDIGKSRAQPFWDLPKQALFLLMCLCSGAFIWWKNISNFF